MKKAIGFFILAVLVQLCFSQSLPPELQNYDLYRQYLNSIKEQESVISETGTPSYRSPELFPDTLFEKEGYRRSELETQIKSKEEIEKHEDEFYLEPVIIDDETVQVIRKATPKKLVVYGSDIFKGDYTQHMPISQSPVSDDYILGVGDRIYIYLWGNVDMEYDLEIDREGRIFIPKAGSIAIAGYSIKTAKEKISNFLESIYSNFNLDLSLGKLKSIKVFVFGEVNIPGGYVISGLGGLLNAIDMAKGPNDRGSFRDIKLIRNGRVISTFDLYQYFIKGNYQEDIHLASNDIIFVPKAGRKIKVRGLINHPSIYELRDEESFEDLISFCGDYKPEASLNNIMIDRIMNKEHRIITLNAEDSLGSQVKLFDGDDISVFSIDKIRRKQVSLIGHAAQPGQYELLENLTVSDLVKGGERLLDDTYRNRADLIRISEDLSESIINVRLDSAITGDPEHDLYLQDGDKLVVYSIWDIRWKKVVTVSGAVKKPGEYKLYENMKVSDLVFEAGGILKNTYLLDAQLARVVPGLPAQVINLDFQTIYEFPGGPEDVLLQENDYLFIREVPGWKLTEVVDLQGEVNFPGKYALTKENERLTELIERAGGLTPEAFLKGCTFVRPAIQKNIQGHDLESIILSTQEAVLDSAGNLNISPILFTYDTTKLSRIIVDLEAAMKGNLEEDIILEDEDQIYIPSIPTGVSVVGAVPSSGTITYIKGKNVNFYINKAGGFTKNADKNELRLVKANGKVIKCSGRTKNIEPGDIIVVPQTIKKQTDWGNILKDAVAIVSGIATTVYILLRL